MVAAFMRVLLGGVAVPVVADCTPYGYGASSPVGDVGRCPESPAVSETDACWLALVGSAGPAQQSPAGKLRK